LLTVWRRPARKTRRRATRPISLCWAMGRVDLACHTR